MRTRCKFVSLSSRYPRTFGKHSATILVHSPCFKFDISSQRHPFAQTSTHTVSKLLGSQIKSDALTENSFTLSSHTSITQAKKQKCPPPHFSINL